eukprot:416909-Prorocentrum_minimum.AAC.1
MDQSVAGGGRGRGGRGDGRRGRGRRDGGRGHGGGGGGEHARASVIVTCLTGGPLRWFVISTYEPKEVLVKLTCFWRYKPPNYRHY